MSPRRISRRKFLQAAGTGVATLASLKARRALAQTRGIAMFQEGSGIDFTDETLSYNEVYGYPPLLGRVHGAMRLRIFTEPTPNSDSVRNVYWGYIGPIYRSVRGERYDARSHSEIWFETNDGYIHSAFFVPCHEVFNAPEEVTGNGFWGEVTVPVAWQHRRPSFEGYRFDFDHYKGFFGQVHRVVERADDADGRAWYRIFDDIEPNRQAWVQAKHFRHVALSEFAPISPDVQDKLIEINLGEQTLTCYETGSVVFKTRIASGTSLTDPSGNEIDFSTPYGDYQVQRKRPSRRMRGGESFGMPYDVNGVPWCTYFSYTGAAIHGAYWHNNFGLPRSHGCINVTSDAAKWVYRWSQPYLGYDEDYRWVEPGEIATPIIVV